MMASLRCRRGRGDLVVAPSWRRFGVREYRGINATTLATMVHRKPSGKVYDAVEEVAPGNTLTPLLVPAFAVSPGSLELHLD